MIPFKQWKKRWLIILNITLLLIGCAVIIASLLSNETFHISKIIVAASIVVSQGITIVNYFSKKLYH